MKKKRTRAIADPVTGKWTGEYEYEDAMQEAWEADEIMLYDQKKRVTKKLNPPQTGDTFQNNNRQGGYADYEIGYYYLSAEKEVIMAYDGRTGQPLKPLYEVEDEEDGAAV